MSAALAASPRRTVGDGGVKVVALYLLGWSPLILWAAIAWLLLRLRPPVEQVTPLRQYVTTLRNDYSGE